MATHEHVETFIFEGTKLECVQGRFINCRINQQESVLSVKDFEIVTDSSLSSEYDVCENAMSYFRLKQKFNLKLPDCLEVKTIVGKVTCVGYTQNLYIFQYVTGEKHSKYVRFIFGDATEMTTTIFNDTHHLFPRDSAAVDPIECLLSPNRKICLLRLPQSILRPKKWSKLLICTKTDDRKCISASNPITGTKASRFQDRKFQLAAFHPMQPSHLVMMMIDSYCSKCKISVHDFETDKEVSQCTRKLNVSISKQADTDSCSENEDIDEEELVYFNLQGCSLTFTKSGSILVVTCLITDNSSRLYCHVFFFEADTFNLIKTDGISKEIFFLKKNQHILPLLSVCDSFIRFLLMEKDTGVSQELFRCRIPKQINLKDLCRSVIIRSARHSNTAVKYLPLPSPLIQYLEFNPFVLHNVSADQQT